ADQKLPGERNAEQLEQTRYGDDQHDDIESCGVYADYPPPPRRQKIHTRPADDLCAGLATTYAAHRAFFETAAQWRQRFILDAGTWEAAQFRRSTAGPPKLGQRRRPKRILSGLVTCGVCGGNYIVQTRDYVGCSNHANKRKCRNARKVA